MRRCYHSHEHAECCKNKQRGSSEQQIAQLIGSIDEALPKWKWLAIVAINIPCKRSNQCSLRSIPSLFQYTVIRWSRLTRAHRHSGTFHKMDKSIQISVIDDGTKKFHSDAVTFDEAIDQASKLTGHAKQLRLQEIKWHHNIKSNCKNFRIFLRQKSENINEL